MTLTTIDRRNEYRQRRLARQRVRSTDYSQYVHFCAGSQDGAHRGCGQSINYDKADDFVTVCPNPRCSKTEYDYRVFRYYGDPLEYERSARSDWVGGLVALLFAVLAAAILVATLFI